MYKLVKKKEWERTGLQLQIQEQILKDKENKIEELESLCQMLESENRRRNSRLMEAKRENRRLEEKVRERLWKKVQEILIHKENQADFAREICGCYHNSENGKWEVVTGFGLADKEDAERMLFSEPADARCYYELMQVFGMSPFNEKSEETCWNDMAETA